MHPQPIQPRVLATLVGPCRCLHTGAQHLVDARHAVDHDLPAAVAAHLHTEHAAPVVGLGAQHRRAGAAADHRPLLGARAAACEAAGISRGQIVLDPGFGFGKTVEHNLSLLRRLDRLVALGYPVLVGLSRKSLIGKVMGLPVDKRLYPSIALAVLAVWQGASIVRCHDVRQTREAVAMCRAVRDA